MYQYFNTGYLIENVSVYIFNSFNYYSGASDLPFLTLHFLMCEKGKILWLLFFAFIFGLILRLLSANLCILNDIILALNLIEQVFYGEPS